MDEQRRSSLRTYLFLAGQNLIERKILRPTAPAHEIALKLAKQLAVDIGEDLGAVLKELGLLAAENAVRALTAKGGEIILDKLKDLLNGGAKRR